MSQDAPEAWLRGGRGEPKGTRVLLTDEYLPGKKAEAIPGGHWSPGEGWVAEIHTARQATIALLLFPEIGPQFPHLEELRDSMAQDMRPFDNATPFGFHLRPKPEMKERLMAYWNIDPESVGGLYNPLHEYQQIDLGYIRTIMDNYGSAYIGWDRGLGKTSATCILADELDCKRIVVVCRNAAKVNIWHECVEALLPDHQCLVLPNEKKKREEMLASIHKRKDPEPYVLIVHYEALAIIAGKNSKGKMHRAGWDKLGPLDMVCADEVHRLSNPKAKMTHAIKYIDTKYKLALSGSIIQNRVEELFSVLQWLFPDRYKSQWRDWNNRYLDYIDGGYGRVCIGVKANKIEDLRQELGVFTVYRRKEDELDLPEKITETVHVDLLPEQLKVYEDLRDTLIAEVDGADDIKSLDGAAMLGKLRQVATGLECFGGTGSSKLDRAVEQIQENPDEAFVVFSWFKAPCYALQERLAKAEIESWVATGDQDEAKERTPAVAAFQLGERQVFIGTIATLSESIQLHRASNVIFLDRSWNPEETGQAVDRVHRQGQARRTTITHLVTRDTVDELRVAPVIRNKESLRRLILGS